MALPLMLLTVLAIFSSSAVAQGPLPSNDYDRGLVYDGLEVAASGPCLGGFRMTLGSNLRTRELCTHGPDPAPEGVNVQSDIAPVGGARPTAASSVVCDGDGVTGKRVQLIYAHASDVPDRYATYLASFEQWAADMDAIYLSSAQQTGGTRRIRFVTDQSCNPVIPDVTLSPSGDDNAVNTFNELGALGYSRPNRKYLVLVDAHVYCGISSVAWDDHPGPTNANNYGNSFARIDAGCWGSIIPAHELMHELGAVQMSAPHSDGNWHCTDGYDNMCDHGGSPKLTFTACPDPAGDLIFDCNHDDYFSTNRLANKYLAKHWNAAINVFLISPPASRVESVVTGRLSGTKLVLTNTFGAPYSVTARIHAVNQYDFDLSRVIVAWRVIRPDGTTQCAYSTATDRKGNTLRTCAIPISFPLRGLWTVHVDALTIPGYPFDGPDSVVDHTFTLR